MFSTLRLARFACLLNSVCCGSILQSSRLRILALFPFFFFRWRCLGKSNIVGTGFAFDGPRPPSKCLEHIRVCLVAFRLFSRHAAIHLRLLSCSLIPGAYFFFFFFVIWWKTVKSNTCNFGVFYWVLFLCLTIGTVVGTTVMSRHFHAKSKKSPQKHCTSI